MSSCSICLDQYTDPKALLCGHSFCAGCLDSMVKPSNRRNPNGRMKCAHCRTYQGIPPQFRTNFALQEAIAELMALKVQQQDERKKAEYWRTMFLDKRVEASDCSKKAEYWRTMFLDKRVEASDFEKKLIAMRINCQKLVEADLQREEMAAKLAQYKQKFEIAQGENIHLKQCLRN